MKKNSKDSTSNLFNRYVWLVDLIYRRGKITFEEINDCWLRFRLNEDKEDFPLRTFHHHRSAIEQMFEININCDKRNGYKYYIENSDDIEQGGVRTWLLNTFAVNNLINESHKLKQRILFEQIPSGQKFLTPIIEAMRNNLSVEITYRSFWDETSRAYEIQPYCIKVFRQRWYVIGLNPKKNKIMTYGLDRITDLNITENKFKLPQNFDGETYFANSFGIIVDDDCKPETVRIKVCDVKNNYIKALPLHHSQEIESEIPGYTIFKYYISPTYDFKQEILSQGIDFEVLSPEWFRKEIAKIIEEQHQVYREG